MVNSDFYKFEWDNDILETEKYYPNTITLARIEWAGDIIDEKL